MTEPSETPFIDLRAQAIKGTEFWAIWLKTMQNVSFEPYCSGLWRVLGSAGSFTIKQSVLWIPVAPVDRARRYAPVIVSDPIKDIIVQLASDFNAHHAKIAEDRRESKAEYQRRREAEKAKEPRRILEVVELGSATTATECRDCKDHDGRCVGAPRCKRYDKAMVWTPYSIRCQCCLAAEEAYKALRGLLKVTDDG